MFIFGNYIYTHSRKILQAFDYNEVMQCLHTMQLHTKRNKKGYYVGYLTYECGLLLQDSYYNLDIVKTKSNEPLLYFELFLRRKKFHHTCKVIKKYLKKDKQYKKSQQLFSIIKPLDKMRYASDFSHIKANIAAGHTYQVNYTQEITLAPLLQLDSFAYFQLLCQRQNTPYKAYIANKYIQILSFSPELFFHFSYHKIKTEPMKGTIKRAFTTKQNTYEIPQIPLNRKQHRMLYKAYKKAPKTYRIDKYRDFCNLKTLYYDSKNRSENVMIVDLLRNDLSRIALQGSVCVKELFTIRTYPTLHQMVSAIEAKLPRHYGIIEILHALFPCGSITGAPKHKTTAIISMLENRKRHVYCGAIGVISAKESIMSVPIRTLYKNTKETCYHYGVGSGVVWDSDCWQEFDELELKCKFLAGD